MADIFISYNRENASAIDALVGALEAHRLTIWLDRHGPQRGDFGAVIRRELAQAKVVLVCWTPEAAKSTWVAAEADEGRQQRKYVGVLLSTCNLPLPFNRENCADLRQWNGRADDTSFLRLIQDVGALVGRNDLERLASAQIEVQRKGEEAKRRAQEARQARQHLAKLRAEAFTKLSGRVLAAALIAVPVAALAIAVPGWIAENAVQAKRRQEAEAQRLAAMVTYADVGTAYVDNHLVGAQGGEVPVFFQGTLALYAEFHNPRTEDRIQMGIRTPYNVFRRCSPTVDNVSPRMFCEMDNPSVGEHAFEVRVNGQVVRSRRFRVERSDDTGRTSLDSMTNAPPADTQREASSGTSDIGFGTFLPTNLHEAVAGTDIGVLEVNGEILIEIPDSAFTALSRLSRTYSDRIERISRLLAQTQGHVEVEGHMDSANPEAVSRDRSERRAFSVASLLISGGVERDRIVVRGFGGSMPIASNQTAEGRAQNRRVLVRVKSN